MRYFVLGDQGQKYGPADVPTLNQWATEGRLLPTTQLEDETSGERMAASAVSGITFAPAAVAAPPSAGVSYPRPAPQYVPQATNSGDAMKSILLSAGMLVLSLVLTFTIGALGIYTALVGIGAGWKAKDDKPAIGWVLTVLNVAAALFSLYWRTVGSDRV